MNKKLNVWSALEKLGSDKFIVLMKTFLAWAMNDPKSFTLSHYYCYVIFIILINWSKEKKPKTKHESPDNNVTMNEKCQDWWKAVIAVKCIWFLFHEMTYCY